MKFRERILFNNNWKCFFIFGFARTQKNNSNQKFGYGINSHFFNLLPTLLYMVCCVFQVTNLVNNYRPRKSARTFASKQKTSNKLYTVLATGFSYILIVLISSTCDYSVKNLCERVRLQIVLNGGLNGKLQVHSSVYVQCLQNMDVLQIYNFY